MNKLIAVVGMSGSGKSVATDYLVTKGYNKIYFGGVVLDAIKDAGLPITPDSEKNMRSELREKYGMAAMAIVLLPKIEKSFKKGDTVLDGLYSWDEYLVLKEKFGESLKLICIVTDKKLRYKRVATRKIRPLSRSEVIQRDISEIENIAKGGPIAMADFFILNNGTVKSYDKEIDKILDELDKDGN